MPANEHGIQNSAGIYESIYGARVFEKLVGLITPHREEAGHQLGALALVGEGFIVSVCTYPSSYSPLL